MIDQASALLASPYYSEQCDEVIRIICSVLESSEKAVAKIARTITGETTISLGDSKDVDIVVSLNVPSSMTCDMPTSALTCYMPTSPLTCDVLAVKNDALEVFESLLLHSEANPIIVERSVDRLWLACKGVPVDITVVLHFHEDTNQQQQAVMQRISASDNPMKVSRAVDWSCVRFA